MSRKRTERRAVERALRKGVVKRERLSTAAPGGAPERALVVTSAAVIESQARATPCPQCGGELELQAHQAEADHLRVVRLQCRLCHAPRALWFRIEARLPS
jgi:hypothetical protein